MGPTIKTNYRKEKIYELGNNKKAINIAYAFLKKADGDRIDSIKLHKLLFFAFEEYLFQHHKLLFENKIYAKKNGMVIDDVIIDDNNTSSYDKGDRTLPIKYKKTYSYSLDEKENNIVSFTWALYGHLGSSYLETLSHSYTIWQDNVDTQKEITGDIAFRYKNKIEKIKSQRAYRAKYIIDQIDRESDNA